MYNFLGSPSKIPQILQTLYEEFDGDLMVRKWDCVISEETQVRTWTKKEECKERMI